MLRTADTGNGDWPSDGDSLDFIERDLVPRMVVKLASFIETCCVSSLTFQRVESKMKQYLYSDDIDTV